LTNKRRFALLNTTLEEGASPARREHGKYDVGRHQGWSRHKYWIIIAGRRDAMSVR
jgi:hypothetical protein